MGEKYMSTFKNNQKLQYLNIQIAYLALFKYRIKFQYITKIYNRKMQESRVNTSLYVSLLRSNYDYLNETRETDMNSSFDTQGINEFLTYREMTQQLSKELQKYKQHIQLLENHIKLVEARQQYQMRKYEAQKREKQVQKREKQVQKREKQAQKREKQAQKKQKEILSKQNFELKKQIMQYKQKLFDRGEPQVFERPRNTYFLRGQDTMSVTRGKYFIQE